MLKQNNKGFTVVELVVSFALAMIVAYFLFNLLYSLKNLAVDSRLKTELLQKQALMVRELEDDLENKKLVLATNCGKNCLDFFYDDATTKRLTLDTTNHYFRYGIFALKLLEGSYFGMIDVSNEQVITTGGGIKNDSIFKIKIPITHKLVKGDYGINIVYQYNSYETSFNDLVFGNALDNILYLKGSQNMVISTDTPYQEPGYFWLDSSSTQRTDGVTVSGTVGKSEGTYTLTYKVTYSGKTYTRTRNVTVKQKTYDFDYVNSAQVFQAPYKGTYQIELWGAEGGSGDAEGGGNGAYTSGNIVLNKGEKLYVYVGQENSTFNGGGSSSVSNKKGGGATDVRLSGGAWNDVTGLKNRIMVAAGGGGVTSNAENAQGGVGGTLTGGTGSAHMSVITGDYVGYGGTQTAGGRIGSSATSGSAGKFGIGGTGGVGPGDTSHVGAGGGGGYYGGGGSAWHAGAGGGSSFISGYTGCNSVNSSGAASGSPNHFSGKVFTNGKMIDGGHLMPNARTGVETLGNETNGYARITLISIQN